MDLIDTYNRVVNVEYRGEKYSVRDNGSVLRHPKNPDKKNMMISGCLVQI